MWDMGFKETISFILIIQPVRAKSYLILLINYIEYMGLLKEYTEFLEIILGVDKTTDKICINVFSNPIMASVSMYYYFYVLISFLLKIFRIKYNPILHLLESSTVPFLVNLE